MPRSILMALLTVSLGGCILFPIPTPHGSVLEGAEVQPSHVESLEPARTTKEEVTRRFGTPTIWWRDENILAYRWVQRKGLLIWAVGGGYSSAGGVVDITAEYAFLIKFDEADRFRSSEIVRKPSGKPFGQFLLDWRDSQRAKEGTEFKRP